MPLPKGTRKSVTVSSTGYFFAQFGRKSYRVNTDTIRKTRKAAVADGYRLFGTAWKEAGIVTVVSIEMEYCLP